MKLREVIFWFHLICGIIVGGFIIVMSVTGAILAFEPQIIDYAERHVQTIRSFAGRQR
ncbi:MAG: PepSY domain-containing protein, partial [Candidatus Omnitrophica bacterium]|nr:PepSY domain-containing protein [Candidatus Omnitrophota bacterium]